MAHKETIVGATGSVTFPTTPTDGVKLNVSGWAARITVLPVIKTQHYDAFQYVSAGEISLEGSVIGKMIWTDPPLSMFFVEADGTDIDLDKELQGSFVLFANDSSTISFEALIHIADLTRNNIDGNVQLTVLSNGPVYIDWAIPVTP